MKEDSLIKQQLRVNDKIRAREVRLIASSGEQLGLMPIEQAQERATRESLDLVEVAPDAAPPVCKIMDYRRYTFEQKRRLKESKKKTKSLEMKEIKLRPNIDPHDYSIKLRHVREFIEKGHKVKVTMRYRAREMRHVEIGTQVLTKMKIDLHELAEADATASGREGARAQVMVLAPKKKK